MRTFGSSWSRWAASILELSEMSRHKALQSRNAAAAQWKEKSAIKIRESIYRSHRGKQLYKSLSTSTTACVLLINDFLSTPALPAKCAAYVYKLWTYLSHSSFMEQSTLLILPLFTNWPSTLCSPLFTNWLSTLCHGKRQYREVSKKLFQFNTFYPLLRKKCT